MKCLCPKCRRERRIRRAHTALVVVLFAAAVLMALYTTACGTVVQTPVSAQTASYDGGAATSGILSLQPDGAIVTPHFRDRYLELAKLYGAKFLPALDPEREFGAAGADGNFRISSETLEHFLTMAAWHRMGRPPATH